MNGVDNIVPDVDVATHINHNKTNKWVLFNMLQGKFSSQTCAA